MSGPTLRQLRSWHRRLSTAHSRAVDIAEEAEAAIDDHSIVVIISDPIIELHAALCLLEGMIEEKIALRARIGRPAR